MSDPLHDKLLTNLEFVLQDTKLMKQIRDDNNVIIGENKNAVIKTLMVDSPSRHIVPVANDSIITIYLDTETGEITEEFRAAGRKKILLKLNGHCMEDILALLPPKLM